MAIIAIKYHGNVEEKRAHDNRRLPFYPVFSPPSIRVEQKNRSNHSDDGGNHNRNDNDNDKNNDNVEINR